MIFQVILYIYIKVWHGIILVLNGLYKNGKFKFKLEFPKNFPVSRPNITFVSKMYHPLIDLNGKLDN